MACTAWNRNSGTRAMTRPDRNTPALSVSAGVASTSTAMVPMFMVTALRNEVSSRNPMEDSSRFHSGLGPGSPSRVPRVSGTKAPT